MKKNNTLFCLLIFLCQFTFGQNEIEKNVLGQITADSSSVENINIINLRSKNTTATNKTGEFRMLLRIGDILVLSSFNLETRRKTIKEGDLELETLSIKMNPKMNPLKEVIVNENSAINAENLGIVPYDQKKYTPAERKLYTARSGLLDPLINKMSGRTGMLKKEVLVERNEKLLLKFDGLYEDNYYIEVLKIPKEYIKGFQYFLIEDSDFARALDEKNKTMTLFLIKRLALNYHEIITNEQNITF